MLKSGIYDFVICRGGTDMCFVLGFGRRRPDLKQYRISGLTCHFLFSAVFVFQVILILKLPNKFPENLIKTQCTRSFPNNQEGDGGDPPGPHAPWWRDQ